MSDLMDFTERVVPLSRFCVKRKTLKGETDSKERRNYLRNSRKECWHAQKNSYM